MERTSPGKGHVTRVRGTALQAQAPQGPSRAHNLVVIEEGIKVEKMGIPPDAGQFLETRLHQINEVARLLNLPPTLIGGSLEAGSIYANQTAEAQRLIDQLPAPVGQPLGQELDRKLLTKAERATRYFQLPT